ncbi:uncharacterized protein LOC142229806 [Haematobia irritans]|uniref:uncharacterized protein LOC142229806 n=1 Tax=Haematobia irritans TaxID=7368 RepID=UPI003F4FF213
MHLFFIYFFVILLTAKKPNLKKSIYIVLGIFAFIIPGILTYVYRLDGNVYLNPEYYRYLTFLNNETLYKTYTPFYCNLGGYLVGLLAAEFYPSDNYQKLKIKLNKYIRNRCAQIAALVILLTVGFGLLFTSLLVIDRNNGEPSLWLAIYGGTFRNIWAIYGGISMIMMLLKFTWIAYDLCSAEVSRLLGRITFQIFLWHVPILKLAAGYYTDAFEISIPYVTWFTIFIVLLTIFVAFIMTLTVEFPLGNMVNYLLKIVLTPRRTKGQEMLKKRQ